VPTPTIGTARRDDQDGAASMTLTLRQAGEADRAGWTAFVASRPEGDVLQSWAWGKAGNGEPGEHWVRLVVVDGGDHIRGLAQVLDRATAFGRTILYVPHGPLWDRGSSDAAEVLARLLTGLKAHARSRRGIVLKLDPRGSGEAAPDGALERALLATSQRSTHDLQAPTTRIVDLTAGVDPLAGWSKDARAEARRAEREGVTVRLDRRGDPAQLDAFHALLSATSERAGFRMRSREFLARLAEPLAASDDWFMAIAEFEGTPIAGAIAPRCGDRAYYLYAASARDGELSRKRGPYAAMAALQRGLRGAGTASLDLWGVRERDDDMVDAAWEGFSLFKRRFGGAPMRHPGTFDIVIDPTWNRIRDLRERVRSAWR
jgi:lipid II:glycine glycyltransferase (peptidoglycan interpeptide bridge formation enzyme)